MRQTAAHNVPVAATQYTYLIIKKPHIMTDTSKTTHILSSFRGILTRSAFIALCAMTAATAHSQPSGQRTVRQCLQPNSPVGVARGIWPGRVVWSHAPGAATWEDKSRDDKTAGKPDADDMWFADRYNSDEACEWLVQNTVLSLTKQKKLSKAWNDIFAYFNKTHDRGSKGYRKGEKIAIKVNNNNTFSHSDNPSINASPQLVLALLKTLVEDAGVPEEAITVAEPSRFITDCLYNKCHEAYPGVRFVDNAGGDGRVKSEYVADAMHYSRNNGRLARGISTAFTEADYVINMALLKGHVGQGVTLCGKNWYGTMSIHADWRKNFHDNFNQNKNGRPKYITFVDFMGHKDLGGKTLIWFIDALYAAKFVDTKPGPKWTIPPFNNEWPCSLFGSLDPVAIDMVGVDFLTSQFPNMPDADCSDMYLVEAASADNPPSGTTYDPEGDRTPLKSLGTAEHWNNVNDKQYSRNMGRDEGIELVYSKKQF